MKALNKRDISDTFFEDLKEGSLKPLLDIVKFDDTLCLELRGDNVVIYYRGGALYTIYEKAEHIYEISFNENYSTNKDIDKASDNRKLIDVGQAVDGVGSFKLIMDRYFSEHRKLEREFQQLILRENNYSGAVTDATDYYILDIEYAYNDDDIRARYDMLAIRWPSISRERKIHTDIPLTFIEVKYGDGAISSDNGAAGISKHIDDYIALRRKPEIISDIAEDMARVFRKKHALGLVTSYADKDLDITIDDKDVEFVFIFANHDPDKTKIKSELEYSIYKYQDTDNEYLDEIKVAKASEMGYGLFAYENGKYTYPTIRHYLETN